VAAANRQRWPAGRPAYSRPAAHTACCSPYRPAVRASVHAGASRPNGIGQNRQSMSHDFKPATAPVVIVPFVWIGDFVRCHSVVKLLREQMPERPVDMVSSTLCAPLADYMPGVRQAIVADLPRRRLGISLQRQLAGRLREGRYGQALIMSRKWKAALAPWLAAIPRRTGFSGEIRFGLLNDVRFGERALPRMIDQMGALALPKGAALPRDWPLPELEVPADDLQAWLARRGIADAD